MTLAQQLAEALHARIDSERQLSTLRAVLVARGDGEWDDEKVAAEIERHVAAIVSDHRRIVGELRAEVKRLNDIIEPLRVDREAYEALRNDFFTGDSALRVRAEQAEAQLSSSLRDREKAEREAEAHLEARLAAEAKLSAALTKNEALKKQLRLLDENHWRHECPTAPEPHEGDYPDGCTCGDHVVARSLLAAPGTPGCSVCRDEGRLCGYCEADARRGCEAFVDGNIDKPCRCGKMNHEVIAARETTAPLEVRAEPSTEAPSCCTGARHGVHSVDCSTREALAQPVPPTERDPAALLESVRNFLCEVDLPEDVESGCWLKPSEAMHLRAAKEALWGEGA